MGASLAGGRHSSRSLRDIFPEGCSLGMRGRLGLRGALPGWRAEQLDAVPGGEFLSPGEVKRAAFGFRSQVADLRKEVLDAGGLGDHQVARCGGADIAKTVRRPARAEQERAGGGPKGLLAHLELVFAFEDIETLILRVCMCRGGPPWGGVMLSSTA